MSKLVAAKPDAKVRWRSLWRLRNWRPMIVLTAVLFSLILGMVYSPIATLMWAVGIPVSIALSLILHELGHAITASVLGFKVLRLLVIGGGRRKWKSKNGAMVINSLIQRRVVMSPDGTYGVLSVNLTIEGRAAISSPDETAQPIRAFFVVAAGPLVNAIIGVIAILVGFYPLTVISLVMLTLSLFGGPGSDGWQMAAILRGGRYRQTSGRYV